MKSKYLFFGIIAILLSFSACSPTKNLKKSEYMLVKNSVKMVDIHNSEFDNLDNYVRPIPNKKFMGIFPIKTSIWACHQPKYDSIKNVTKDSKLNQWMRKKGEPQVLYDSNNVLYSIRQLNLAMFQKGFFNVSTTPHVSFLKNHKAKVNYVVTANQPFFIRNIEYNIEIPEYKKIITTDFNNSLIKKNMQYDEELLLAERDRMVNHIRDHGYFYVSSSVITIEVDTINAFQHLNDDGNPTLIIRFLVNFNEIQDEKIREKHQFKYTFDHVYIYTNYDPSFEKEVALDTVLYYSVRDKNDQTRYTFYYPMREKKFSKNKKIIKDFHSRIICPTIYTKKGVNYSYYTYDMSYKKLRALKNFSIINISFTEDLSQLDTVNQTGVLNTTYKLTRNKRHGIAAQVECRTDRSNVSFTYTNKNIFKGAEYLNVNTYGSIYYYNWINNRLKGKTYDNLVYGEYGGSVSLDIPRLIFFKRLQNPNAIGYNTTLKMGASYSQLFSRLMLFANASYNWSTSNFSHSISPIDISTIDTRGLKNDDLINSYPSDYQRKFAKSFLMNLKYTLTHILPVTNKKNNFRITLSFESSGSLLSGLNLLFNKNNKWILFNGYNYTTYEKVDLNLRYRYEFDKNNTLLTRFNIGIALPFTKNGIIPFERSFYVGGANSMRGWAFRSLGPGGFSSQNYIERTGDFKIEYNLEYQGTIYKSFKFGLFADLGNIWLASKYNDMENAEFNIKRFYKEIAICMGAGIRLDFNFFIVRLDYGVPLYDPSIPEGDRWINKNWHVNGWWKWTQGLQFGIGHAF